MNIISGREVFTELDELVNPNHTALLLIDIQKDYFMVGGYANREKWDTSRLCDMIPRVKHVLESARSTRIAIVHVQMTLQPDHLLESPAYLRMQMLRAGLGKENATSDLPTRCIKDTEGWEIVEELTPLAGEFIIKKHRSSAFVGTDLDMLLRSNGIKSLVIAGLATESCVMSTVKDAGFYDYYPIVLRDCIASPRLDYHNAACLIMSWDIDMPNSTDVINIWRSKA